MSRRRVNPRKNIGDLITSDDEAVGFFMGPRGECLIRDTVWNVRPWARNGRGWRDRGEVINASAYGCDRKLLIARPNK